LNVHRSLVLRWFANHSVSDIFYGRQIDQGKALFLSIKMFAAMLKLTLLLFLGFCLFGASARNAIKMHKRTESHVQYFLVRTLPGKLKVDI
jgi:hypothetical protein